MRHQILNRTISITLTFFTVLALALFPAPASAEEDFPAEGGSWQYGDNGFRAYSNYWNPTKTHGSSVSNRFKSDTSPCTAANKWSYAQINVTLGFQSHYYYRLCSPEG